MIGSAAGLSFADFIVNTGPVVVIILAVVLVVVGFIFHAQLGIESATVALTAAGVMLLIGGQDAEDVILGVEWSTILFFIGLFVVVGGLNSTGVIAMLANGMLELVGDNEMLAIVLILWASALISAFLDNIPFVATLIPMIQTMSRAAWTCCPCGGPYPWVPVWAATAASSAPAPTWFWPGSAPRTDIPSPS